MLSRCIEGIVTMTPETFATRAGAPERAGRALRRLHTCGMDFESRFDLFSMIDEYLAMLKEKNSELPPGYADVVEAAQPARKAPEIHCLCRYLPVCSRCRLGRFGQGHDGEDHRQGNHP